jgi:WD40 repeat protein
VAVQRLLIAVIFFWGSISSLFAQQLIVQASHTGQIETLCFSPDGELVLSGGTDCARLWETRSGRLLRNLKGHNGGIEAAAFSPNGKYIVTGGTDSLAIIWDIETGTPRHTISGFAFRPNKIVFSPNGKTVALGDDMVFMVVNLQSGKTEFVLYDFFSLNSISYNKTGSLLATSGAYFDSLSHQHRVVNVYDTRNWQLVSVYSSSSDLKISECFFKTGTDELIAVIDSGEENFSKLYAFANHKTWEITAQTNNSNNLLFEHTLSPAGNYLAAWGWGNEGFTVCQTNGQNKILNSYTQETKPLVALVFSGDSKKLVTLDKEGVVQYWNAETGELLNTIPTGLGDNATQITADYKGEYFVLGDFDGRLWLAGLQSGILLHQLAGTNVTTRTGVFNADGTRFYTANSDYFLRGWDLTNAKQANQPVNANERVNAMAASANGEEIAYTDNGGTLGVYNIRTGKLTTFTCEKYCYRFISAVFHPTEHKIAAAYCNAVVVIDLDSGTQVLKISSPFQDDQLSKIRYSADGTTLYGLNIGSDIHIWDARTGERKGLIAYYHYRPWNFEVSPDGESLVLICKDTAVRVIDSKEYKETLMIQGFTYRLSSAYLNPANDKILVADGDSVFLINTLTKKKTYSLYTGGKLVAAHWQSNKMVAERDGRLLFYAISSGQELFSIIAFEGEDHLFLLPDRNYTITKNVASQVGWVQGLKRYDFDQFDLQNNRPDKVLQALGCTDTALIEAYVKAWRKRVKRAGINPQTLTAQLHTPDIELKDTDALPLETENGEIEISLNATDTKYPLAQLNVWINGVPLYGAAGKSIGNKKQYSGRLTIPLSEGDNQIQFSVANTQGVESFRPSLNIKYNPAQAQQVRTWFIGFGVNNYKESRYTLHYSAKDIQNLAAWFAQYPNSTTDTFTDARVTRENILALKQKLMSTRTEDRVIIAFSGHGLLDDSLNFYYATQDIDFKHPAQRGVLYEEVEALLDGIPARKKLLLMDACHSGETDKDDEIPAHTETQNQPDTGTLLITRFGSKGLELLDDVAQSGTGLQNSFELMQELFADLSRGTGAHIISAAAGNSYAYEKNELKNGVFTWCILNGLQNKAADADEDETITVSELENYVKVKVSELTSGAQKPTSRSGLVQYNWEF